MSETKPKFTPGPWVIGDSDYYSTEETGVVITTDDGDGWEICHMCDGIDADQGVTILENAKLVAAAPELYDAAVALIKNFENTHSGNTTFAHKYFEVKALIEQLKKIIQKHEI